MTMSKVKLIASAGAVAVGLALAASGAMASPLTISSVVGGAPTGNVYDNLNNLSLGSTSQTTTTGVQVSFTSGDGAVVNGSLSGRYAAPYLSAGNGTLFGDPNNGPDTTHYISTGIGSVTLAMPGAENYLGVLWGSVDAYNTLSFYNGATLIGSITGTDVTAAANGDQGANGTYYVNINSTTPFDTVVASSTQYAFEFDNLAFNNGGPGGNSVPEPAMLSIFGLGLAGLGLAARRRRIRA